MRNNVYTPFEDDGGGIDREAVRRVLRTAGKLVDGDDLSEEAMMNAIFEPGFSTRPHSDVLAGRGMGMNIIKRARPSSSSTSARWPMRLTPPFRPHPRRLAAVGFRPFESGIRCKSRSPTPALAPNRLAPRSGERPRRAAMRVRGGPCLLT